MRKCPHYNKSKKMSIKSMLRTLERFKRGFKRRGESTEISGTIYVLPGKYTEDIQLIEDICLNTK